MPVLYKTSRKPQVRFQSMMNASKEISSDFSEKLCVNRRNYLVNDKLFMYKRTLLTTFNDDIFIHWPFFECLQRFFSISTFFSTIIGNKNATIKIQNLWRLTVFYICSSVLNRSPIGISVRPGPFLKQRSYTILEYNNNQRETTSNIF